MGRVLPVIISILCLSPPAQSAEIRSFDRTFDAQGIQRLVLDIPVTELEIKGSSTDRIEAEIKVECEWRKRSCEDLADEIDLVSRKWDDELTIEVEGIENKWRSLGISLDIRIWAPASLSLELDVGVGEIEISGFENDVYVDVGVGEVEVNMDESRVHSVSLDAGIGEVQMSHNGGRLEAGGIFDNVLRWDEGSGPARLRLKAGVGEIDVRLR
jgi:hypothetical protein